MKNSTNVTSYNSDGELISLEDIAGNVNKNLYNLGAFDTFKDNGDGTGTITRATGYLTKDDFSQDVNNCGVIQWISPKGLHSFNSNDIVADDSLYVCNKNYIRVSASSQWLSTSIDNSICANNVGYIIILTETLPDDLLVQYKLSSSTTETVILNQTNTVFKIKEVINENLTDTFLTSSSTSPAETIGGTWTSLGSFTVGSNTVYAWKRV
jgi:hypothetical protein